MYMKKLYSLFLTLFALLGAGFTAQAQEAVLSVTPSTTNMGGTNQYDETITLTASETQKFTVTSFSNNNNAWTTDPMRCGSKSIAGGTKASIASDFSFTAKINKVTVDVKRIKNGTNDKLTSATLYVADNATFTDAATYTADITGLGSTPNSTATFTFDVTAPAENNYYKIEFALPKASNNGWLAVNKFEFFGSEAGDTREECGLAYSAETYTVTVGEAYELPVLSNPHALAVTYESSNPVAATISDAGVVTIPAETATGKTKISAKFAGDDTYKAGSASYELTVVNPNLPGMTAGNPFTVAQAMAACTAYGPKDVYVKGFITRVTNFNATYGSLTYYIADEAGSATDLQVYGGLNIGGEKFTGLGDLSADGTVLVKGNLKLYKDAPEIDLNSVIIEYTAPAVPTVATPTFSIKSGEVVKGTKVAINCSTEGATVRYAMGPDASEIDGDVEGWEIYNGEIEINEAVTIKAIAMKNGYNDSDIATATYTVRMPADATFNFSAPETLTPAYPADKGGEGLTADGDNGNMQAIVSDVDFTKGNVTVTSTKGSSTDAKIYYQSGGAIQLRVYSGGSTTIKSTDPDNNITKIVFTYNNGATSYNKVTAPTNGTWDKTTGTWTGDAQSVTFAYTGTQQINTIEVFCTKGLTTGIDNVETDDTDAPAEYFNLQGVRVDNPQNGLYIKRQGSKVTKVIVK